MNRLCTDEKTYLHWVARLRSQLLTNGSWKGICDEGMEPLLTALNSLPGLVTIFSCASHPEEKVGGFYVMMAARPEGVEALHDIMAELQSWWVGLLANFGVLSGLGCGLTLEYSQAFLPNEQFDARIGLFPPKLSPEYGSFYTCATVRMDFEPLLTGAQLDDHVQLKQLLIDGFTVIARRHRSQLQTEVIHV